MSRTGLGRLCCAFAPCWVLSGVLAGSAAGQIVIRPAVRVDKTNPGDAFEPAIAVSRLDPFEVVAAAMEHRLSNTFNIGYGVSLGSGATEFVDGVLLPPAAFDPATSNGNDPMIATDAATGEFWVGGVLIDVSPGVIYANRKAPQAPVIGCPPSGQYCPVVVDDGPTPAPNDKCLMASGVDSLGNHALYVTWFRQDGEDIPDFPLYLSRSTDRGLTWSDPAISMGRRGFAPAPAVLSDGTLVVVFAEGHPFINPPSPPPHRIALVSSTDGGSTWTPPPTAPAVSVSGDTVLFQERGSFANPGIIPGRFRARPFPLVAVDPRNDEVYVTWCQPSPADATDVDVYLAKLVSINGQFVSVARLQIALPGDQFMPAIAVDEAGGINLIWYDTRFVSQVDNSDTAWLDVVYRRYGSISDLTPDEKRLTTASFNTGAIDFIGDYQMIDASGCFVYPVYSKIDPNPPGAGLFHYFVNRIQVCTPADFDANALVNENDLVAYLDAYSAQSPEADLNSDQAVQTDDFQTFIDAYTDQ